MQFKNSNLLAAALLLGSANAHFFITYPDPIPGSNPKDPLDASGADFPCHGANLAEGTVTDLQAGQVVPLEFGLGAGANTAVHGGGSCQVSVTYETDAAAMKNSSAWYVMQSFIGGCPTDFTSNLENATMCPQNYPDCVNNIQFTVPNEVQNGNAIFAWTWFNNVGDREMYMNCAKVSISGGQNQLSELPNMMIANVGNGCSTTESTNVDFPDPGKYVVKEATLNFPTKLAVGGNACGTGSGSGGVTAMSTIGGANQATPTSLPPPDTVGGANPPDGGSGADAGAGGAASPATSSANNGQYTQTTAATTAAQTTAASGAGSGAGAGSGSGSASSGGVFAPGASSAAGASAAGAAPTTLATSASPAAASAASAAAPAGTGGGAISGACATGQVACTAQGFYCINSSTFGMCAYGCATPMQMAAGTQCENGAVADAVDYPGNPAGVKRRARSVRRHM